MMRVEDPSLAPVGLKSSRMVFSAVIRWSSQWLVLALGFDAWGQGEGLRPVRLSCERGELRFLDREGGMYTMELDMTVTRLGYAQGEEIEEVLISG